MSIYGTVSSVDASRRAGNYAANSAKAAAKQQQYNSEYQAQLAFNQAKQEGMNRTAAAEEENRQARHRRARILAMYAKSGVLLEGSPEFMLGEQARADIMGIDQRNLESMQRQRVLNNQGQNTLITGDWQSSLMISQGNAQQWSYNQQGKAAIISGVGAAVGAGGSAAGSFASMSSTPTPTGGAGTADYGSRTAPTISNGPYSGNGYTSYSSNSPHGLW